MWLTTGALGFGCKSNKASPACKERKYPMARDMTPRQVAEAYLAAWNAHNADAAAALMAEVMSPISTSSSASRRKGVMQRVTRSSSCS